jgi:predicted transcriptional regulator
MTITVRLDAETKRALTRAAKKQGVSNSELIRQCLHDYLDQTGDARLAWELGKDVFGKYNSDRGDLAQNAKRIVREKINARKGRR